MIRNLHHIPLYIKRGLYFQSFDRLYNAYQEFLQALFISRCTYPIAYNKWIREQVEEIAERIALRALRLGRRAALMHVGDSCREDLDGARSAGWQALLVDRRGASGPDRIAALTELPGRLLMTGIRGTSPG